MPTATPTLLPTATPTALPTSTPTTPTTCTADSVDGILWPSIGVGLTALASCPSGGGGSASRTCCGPAALGMLDSAGTTCTVSRTGVWLAPDYSQCSSLALQTTYESALAAMSSDADISSGVANYTTALDSSTGAGSVDMQNALQLVVTAVQSMNTLHAVPASMSNETAAQARAAVASIVKAVDVVGWRYANQATVSPQTTYMDELERLAISAGASSASSLQPLVVIGKRTQLLVTPPLPPAQSFNWTSSSSSSSSSSSLDIGSNATFTIPGQVLNGSGLQAAIVYLDEPWAFPGGAWEVASGVVSASVVGLVSSSALAAQVEMTLPTRLSPKTKHRLATAYAQQQGLPAGSVEDISLLWDPTLNTSVLVYSVRESAQAPLTTVTVPADVQCGFWHPSSQTWRTDGCQRAGQATDASTLALTGMRCTCSHMTSFGVLVRNSGGGAQAEGTNSHGLFTNDLFHDLAGSLTLLCFAVLLVALLLLRHHEGLRKAERILMNICIASMGLYATFLGAVDRRGAGRTQCLIQAGILHYFLLVVLLLMLTEGLYLWLSFVRVLPGVMTVSNMVILCLSCAWLVPVPMVALSAGLAPDKYITEAYCWMDSSSPTAILTFLVPMAVVLMFNAVVYVLAMRNISRMGKQQSQLKASVLFFVLLGLPWGVLFLARTDTDGLVDILVSLTFTGQAVFLLGYHLRTSSRIRAALARTFEADAESSGIKAAGVRGHGGSKGKGRMPKADKAKREPTVHWRWHLRSAAKAEPAQALQLDWDSMVPASSSASPEHGFEYSALAMGLDPSASAQAAAVYADMDGTQPVPADSMAGARASRGSLDFTSVATMSTDLVAREHRGSCQSGDSGSASMATATGMRLGMPARESVAALLHEYVNVPGPRHSGGDDVAVDVEVDVAAAATGEEAVAEECDAQEQRRLSRARRATVWRPGEGEPIYEEIAGRGERFGLQEMGGAEAPAISLRSKEDTISVDVDLELSTEDVLDELEDEVGPLPPVQTRGGNRNTRYQKPRGGAQRAIPRPLHRTDTDWSLPTSTNVMEAAEHVGASRASAPQAGDSSAPADVRRSVEFIFWRPSAPDVVETTTYTVNAGGQAVVFGELGGTESPGAGRSHEPAAGKAKGTRRGWGRGRKGRKERHADQYSLGNSSVPDTDFDSPSMTNANDTVFRSTGSSDSVFRSCDLPSLGLPSTPISPGPGFALPTTPTSPRPSNSSEAEANIGFGRRLSLDTDDGMW